jgi:hypothetical protein
MIVKGMGMKLEFVLTNFAKQPTMVLIQEKIKQKTSCIINHFEITNDSKLVI